MNRHYVTVRLVRTITMEVESSSYDEAVSEAKKRLATMQQSTQDFDVYVLYTQDSNGRYTMKAVDDGA